MRVEKNKRIELGKRSEDLVAYKLRRNGCQILSRNFRTRFGEVDVIARKGHSIYIVEVRSVYAYSGFSPLITQRKFHRIYRAGATFMRMKNLNLDRMRILLASVCWMSDSVSKVEFIPVDASFSR